jgi:hypothetical protein
MLFHYLSKAILVINWGIRFSDLILTRHIHLKGDMNNNKMERLNGEIRDREKVVRGLKKDDSPFDLWLSDLSQLH